MAFGLNRTLNKILGGGTEQTSQIPLETAEQAAARKKLMGFAETGKYGDFTAGAEVPLGYGDFNATDLEKSGLSTLQNLISTNIPDQYKLGDQALQDLLATSPDAINAQFDPFKAQVQRQTEEANNALKRQAGVMGNLYSTDTIRNLGDIQARGNETLTAKLAELTNEALNRRLQAIPLAYQSAQAKESASLNRVAASQEYGSLLRNLNNQSIQARDAELLRRRQELQLPISALSTVANSNAQFGVPTVTTQKQSTLMDLTNLAAKVGGQIIGAKYASAA